jgi:hypothetical protein
MSSKLLYRGQGLYLPPTPYAILIFPFVQLKNLLQVIYNALARMIWAELWRGETQHNTVVNLAAFAVFCVLAWGIYWVQGYAQIIFLLSFLIWSLDWGLAIASYSRTRNRIAVKLLQTDELFLLWQTQSQHFPLTQAQIGLFALNRLTLRRTEHLGGAFAHALGQPWQLSLTLNEGSDYFLDQHSDLSIILPKAQQLVAKLHIPLIFADSYGDGLYAAYPLRQIAIANHPRSPTVQLLKSQKLWQVKTCWRWGNSWRMLQQLCRESGFLLFLIFLSHYMVQFGAVIQVLMTYGQGQNPEKVWVERASFNPNFDVGDGVEIALLIGVILYNGWRLSQVKRVTVDRICVKYFINQTLIYPLPTAQIEGLLLLNKVDPELVVIASNQALTLGHFHQAIESLDFLQSLAAAILNFRPDFRIHP